MKIRTASAQDIAQWSLLRQALWPDHDLASLHDECTAQLQNPQMLNIVAANAQGDLVGFIEAAVYPNQGQPYCHIEGWYVQAALRGQGVGRQLFAQVKQWALHRAIHWLTSDTTDEYPLSPRAHASAGFEQVHQMTLFLQPLKPVEH